MKLCDCCFADVEIKQYIVSESQEKGICEYCSESGSLLEVGELLDFFKQFLSVFEESEDGKPLNSVVQNDWKIFSNNQVCNDILSDVLCTCGGIIDSSEALVSYNHDIMECVEFWDKLKADIKQNRRFISDIQRLEELGWDSLFPEPLTVHSSINLFRARIHENSHQSKYGIDLMGVPPLEKATPGRANPAGIPYLYLSKDLITTLYETRATYLDNLSIGNFRVKDGVSLSVIDVTGEQNSYRSPFICEDINTLVKSKLLMRKISADLSKPLRRNDSEIEYVPTQFICEYIKYIYGADGIMFKSSLYRGGVNYVIFNHSKMECVSVVQHRINKVEVTSEEI